jgi:hypothetical protein
LPLGQEAAKLPPPPRKPPGLAIEAEQVGDFCPLPESGRTTGVEPVARTVPVRQRRFITEMQPQWVLTHRVERSPHGQALLRPMWIQVHRPVRREVVETVWVRRIEDRPTQPPRITPRVTVRTYVVRRPSSRSHGGSGSSVLRMLSRLFTARP